MTLQELRLIFAHAEAVSTAIKNTQIAGNVSSEDVGGLIFNRANGMAKGYLAAEIAEDERLAGYDSGAD